MVNVVYLVGVIVAPVEENERNEIIVKLEEKHDILTIEYACVHECYFKEIHIPTGNRLLGAVVGVKGFLHNEDGVEKIIGTDFQILKEERIDYTGEENE